MVGRKCYDVWKLSKKCRGCPVITAIETGKSAEAELTPENQDHWPLTQGSWLSKAAPVRDAQGNIIGAIEIAINITERKKLEEQLLQVQKMEAIGKLAGGIAHDFNNILAGIMGYASLLKNRLDQSSPLIAAVEKITKSSQRAAELTTALLAFTRGGIYQPKPLNVNLVIDHLLRVIKETVGRKCDIRENLSPDISSVFTDESQIYQLIMNLCINACEAMTAGGTLTVKSIDAEPDDGFFNDHPGLKKGPYVRVSVSDTGAGIDSETRSRMFDPLFTTKVGRPGAGLGLAMVLGIIERHGGGIEVESEPGRGSTFIVYLPFTWEEDRAAPPTPVETLKGDEIILLVDDEEDFRVSIGIRLKWFGYTVIEAASGEDALKVLEERKKGVDLVLLDMIMPGMDGAEAFEKMRKLIPGLSVIICTGYALDETTQEMLQKGAAAFLQKPFKPDELTVKIRQVLDNR